MAAGARGSTLTVAGPGAMSERAALVAGFLADQGWGEAYPIFMQQAEFCDWQNRKVAAREFYRLR